MATPGRPVTWANPEEHRRRLADGINQLVSAISVRGTVDLVTSPTVIEDNRIGGDSIPIITPANSAAASINYDLLVEPGKITVTHSGPGSFYYIVIL